MYAVIRTGGKQYKVKEGDILDVEKLEKKKGDSFEFDDVLLTFDDKEKVNIGTPKVSKAKVKVKVLDPEHKAEKVIIVKYKPKKRYRKKTGHRQKYTRVEVEKITA
jgi:large subunit ribosomal protein L21